jgi:transcription initiation factor TFIID TATA-box-binding protein
MLDFIKNDLEDYLRMESTINIENVVASTKLAEAFDLPKIELDLEGAEYNKMKFPGLVYRVKAPKAAFLIFTSGKVVCTGSKNIEDVRMVITTLADTLKSIGCEKINLDPEIHVQNIVASADLKTRLNLNAVALGLAWRTSSTSRSSFRGSAHSWKLLVLVSPLADMTNTSKSRCLSADLALRTCLARIISVPFGPPAIRAAL